MSDNLPLELQLNIMKWLPIKSLIQCRTVSKAWKSLIDSADFIKHYQGHKQHLLASYEALVDSERKYVSIADDETFPQKKVSHTIPLLLQNPRIIGCSHGLLCLFGDYEDDSDDAIFDTETVVLWNLFIRKAVAVVLPYWVHGTVLGFGVCPRTNDPKIVKILHDNSWDVQIFALNTGVWRSCNNLPRESVQISGSGCKWESLVVLERDDTVWGVWMMEDGDPKTFTKLFNVSVSIPLESMVLARGFRMTSEAIIGIMDDERGQLFGYDPCSKHLSNLGIDGEEFSFYVHSYEETLLLLDQQNLTVYNEV
ncbi:putative F-box domain-containing protein [Helianthus annuus]|uniref:F-box domain-containing protein n=2 Tax=Helianthus annuus TaxID=4232 RepID=A0A9K3IYS7_HELAN|nr:putative F-box domain-containing protein [Helianthus annuus]KAJ0569894.1 putative F-box domain-containing protein [Helianthus annuus]KAJ0584224.1 putative F-box domain-containing protein [Helianthus annuus]KAJ0749893.1 putative F-box domain-containing protein [Helianthus annuus]